MESRGKSVQLKVYVDKKKKKVIFAEADEHFVDMLIGFLNLSLGTIARLVREHADLKDIRVGSMTSLYESVVNLNIEHFSQHPYKDALVNSKSLLPNLIVSSKPYFLKNKAKFIITDSLDVVPVQLDTGIEFLNSLGVEDINLLEERTMCFGLDEFVDLLMRSLLTNNPLTNLMLGGSAPCSFYIANFKLSNSPFISSNSGQKQITLKLVVQKSNKKLLCAQAENLFVELLFSFLTIKLGAYLYLTKDDLPSLGITNLYNSISRLGDGKYLKSKDPKNMVLCPKVATTYPRVTDFLPIYDAKSPLGRFLKEPAAFIVSDNLEVTVASMDTISKLNTLGVPVGDMEILEVSIGEKEAPILLKACLSSTSALTDFVNALSEDTKGSI